MEQMRKLKGGELFDLLRIVDKLDLDLSEIKELLFDNDDNVDVSDDKAVKERPLWTTSSKSSLARAKPYEGQSMSYSPSFATRQSRRLRPWTMMFI